MKKWASKTKFLNLKNCIENCKIQIKYFQLFKIVSTNLSGSPTLNLKGDNASILNTEVKIFCSYIQNLLTHATDFF